MRFSTSITRRITRTIKVLRPAVIVCAINTELACHDPNAQSSQIVVDVEKAGAGKDISSLTTPELAQWFAHQPATFVHKIDGECAPLRGKAPAAWHMRTAEGRVCDAAQQAAALTFTPYDADHTRY
jgi:hypothetical protein